MRWYRIKACQDIDGRWIPQTAWDEKIVSGVGVADAFDAVRRLGWWPVEVIASAWEQNEV